MKIHTVTVRLGKTIPGPEYGGGQFANIKPEVEISAEIEEGEHHRNVITELVKEAKASLHFAIQELIGGVQPPPAHAPRQPVQVVPLTTNGVQQPPAYKAPPLNVVTVAKPPF